MYLYIPIRCSIKSFDRKKRKPFMLKLSRFNIKYADGFSNTFLTKCILKCNIVLCQTLMKYVLISRKTAWLCGN